MKIFQISASYKPAYVYGGPTMSVSKLSEELVKQGLSVEVVTTTANGPVELDVKAGETVNVDQVPVTYYPRMTKDHTHFSPALLSALNRKLKRSVRNQEKPVVHIHAWWNLVSIFACLVAKWRKVPVIISPRGTLSGYSFANKNSGIKDYIHQFLGKGLLEYSYFHVTSEKEKRDVERLVKPRGVFVLPNFVRVLEETPHPGPLLKERGKDSVQKETPQSGPGLGVGINDGSFGLRETPHPDPLLEEREKDSVQKETPQSGPELGVGINDGSFGSGETPHPDPLLEERGKAHEQNERENDNSLKERENDNNTLRLLFISRVEEKKGLELLFECLKDFKADWHLDIAGTGEESYVAKLKQLTADYGIAGKIRWLGHVNNEQKFGVMADHDLMVLPSFDENFANVVIECLSVGTAVLLTENVGLADYVLSKNLGWVCRRTREDLLEKLNEIASQAGTLWEIRDKAPSVIRHDFNEERLVKGYVGMYEEVGMGCEW